MSIDVGTTNPRVLIIDDNDTDAVWDLRFREDRDRRNPPDNERMFVRYGDVCRTPQAGRAILLQALNEKLLPDLVVIDHVLSTGSPEYGRIAEGLNIMRWIRDTFADEAPIPKCVLWTAEYEPGLAYAFVESCGTHAFGRDVPAADVVARLWDIWAGRDVWEHKWIPPRLKLTEAQLKVLPYFEANLPTHEIASRMATNGELTVAPSQREAWVNDRRREIMERANRVRELLGEPRFQGKGLSVALARYAMLHGNVWIPLAYRE
jgi:hypothetical protein